MTTTNNDNHGSGAGAGRTPGARAVEQCMAELGALAVTHPAWYAWFEDVDPDLCGQMQLIELLESAPTSLARGFLMGKLSLRQQIATITGRPML